jgi:hypothetical protein
MYKLNFELKYLIPSVGLYIKLKLLKIAIWCGNFKTLEKRKIFLKYKTTAIRPKNGKLSAIIFVVFKYFPFS